MIEYILDSGLLYGFLGFVSLIMAKKAAKEKEYLNAIFLMLKCILWTYILISTKVVVHG